MDNPLQTFGPNEKGRDFVIGDLHGSFACFENLLRGLGFDPAVDRMFSVADLVDRGPDSRRCLSLIDEDWFHCVIANHEQMMYEAFAGGYMGQFWFQNGGMWGVETWNVARSLEGKKAGRLDQALTPSEEDMDLLDLLVKVEQLPFLITINHKNGKKFHVIHAELPPGHVITDEILSSPGKVAALAQIQSHDGDFFLWGRYKFGPFYKTDMGNRDKIVRTIKANGYADQFNDKLSHIISGHTIMQRPFTMVGQTNIDTGAYYSAADPNRNGFSKVPKWSGLTCICLDDWKFFKATPSTFEEVEPFVVTRDDLK